MPDVELARREGVELVRTGRFQTLTGSWNPTPKDIQAAVEAMDCPAIRKPVIRLGHTDDRFVPRGDGEPALGWFENLRAADGGHTLVADQVTLPWLHSVQAAAYPSRSIEGNYNHRCSEGHLHPFVIHTVALLGVTPPGVQTLRSLNDLPEMLGVAATGEVPEGAEHVQVTVLAGRHSFDESKHARDDDGKFTSGSGGGGGDGSPVQPAPASGLKRNERLAKRIPLGKGETYVGSGTVRDGGFAVAAVDGPDGRTVRLGVGIDPDEIGQWSGANRGGTVVLDQERLDQTREAIAQLLEAAKTGKAKVRALHKEWDRLEAAENKLFGKSSMSESDENKLDEIREQRKANEDALDKLADFGVLEEGVIHAEWGDLHLQAYMSDDSPQFKVEVKASREAPSRFDEILEVRHLTRLAALLEKAGAAKPVQAAAAQVQAAAEVHTGAMVALIPTPEDAARLAVEGGEPAEELHVTLAYLGEAAALGARGRQDVIDGVSTAANGLPQFEAEAFALNVFNPPGAQRDDGQDRDTCLVLGLSGDPIDAVHDLVAEALREALWSIDVPPQHRPWHAHMTLEYTEDLSKLANLVDRIGPVRFDRIRVAFGGEHIDIPLIGPDEDDMVAASAAIRGRIPPIRERLARLVAAAAPADPPPEDPASSLPAAEPEPNKQEEDLVSLSDELRSRLGLADGAEEVDALAAIDALKAAAEKSPEPTAEMIQASANATAKAEQAEAEKDELRKEVNVLASRMEQVTTELAAAKAEQAATVKASVLDDAIKQGKIKPADKAQWETDYDDAPAAITRVLASIAPGTAVPVMAAGHAGPAEPTSGDSLDAEYERLFGEKAGA
ncbi:2'-5' RNA ligase/predicted nuclease with TOPRIM domain [Actinoplanes campanulatus]|uniref:2'-5' RNA ligase/predicted nuclease with TOPRIM domain n=1 Tax=Actinoplanes campanulatus TaxID=113559 RepID=A0A7W5AMT6_9ACTN|nr:phage protease [Actinoplanes campanulatus]MBB3098991.1 2'-5' RNA ligase/predicted nuclease with TOPRIM domain [Actinoplanes campanulatus]GGN39540.1 hypothetical protein GCM10010109_67590 [Actinoplanes campanulatus]GID40151.1 hypothetical protein Aca09nite_66570 [Actinoplanes campanulatus]